MTELLEREVSLAALGAARREGGRLVFVGGEAGVGKTALVRAFARQVTEPVLFGACESLTTPSPLGPIADIAGELGGRLAELVETGGEPRDVARALLAELHTPALLVLEDVHWADEATLDVLRVIGRRIDATQALVLATYRDDEVDGDHPLRAVLGELASAPGGLASSRLAAFEPRRGGARPPSRRRWPGDLPADAGERVLRDRDPGRGRCCSACDGAGRGARSRLVAPCRNPAVARPRRDRPRPRRALAARRRRGRRARTPRRLHHLRRPPRRRGRGNVPARARAARSGERRPRRSASLPPHSNRRGTHGATLRLTRSLTARASRGGGGRHRRRARVRARGSA